MSRAAQLATLPLETPPLAPRTETERYPFNQRWRASSRILFRFVFSYLVLYNFPFPIGQIPYTEWPADKWSNLWKAFVPWVGKHLLHLQKDITVFTNGSGDTTFDWVMAMCYLALALAATVVWSALDRKRTQYNPLLKWLRLYVRFALAAAMISYGAYKVIPSQFPAPSMSRLVEAYGDSSPMGLLWTFMGASRPYEIFAGSAELIGGILLVIPGLTVLGSVVSVAVLTNVFLLNMCYDTPVKLYSFHLLFMGLFLIVPDLRCLTDFFVLGKSSALCREAPLFQRKRLNQAAAVILWMFAVYFVGFSLYQSYTQFKEYNSAKPQHYGMWSVDEFSTDGQIRPPLLTDSRRWRRMFFEFEGFCGLQLVEGTRRNYTLKLDATKKTMSLGKFDEPKWSSVLTYDDSQPDVMTLSGQFDGHQVSAKLRRVDASTFLLKNRGFHWISEYPFNR